MSVVSLENAIRALDPNPEERVLLEKAWAAGGRLRNAVEMAVRSRGLRLLIEGPAGAGKTFASRALAASLSGGVDVIDVDKDRSDSGSDDWRPWAVTLPAVTRPAGQRGPASLRKASQTAYDAAWESVVTRTSEVAEELRAGRSSGVVLDTATALIPFFMDTASAASEDFGTDDDKGERMAAERYRGYVYSAATKIIRQVFALADEAIWTGPAGPVVGIALAHARPVNDKDTREFKAWSVSLGPSTAAEIRGSADFVLCFGMDPSDKPMAKRLRFYARVEESAAGGAKARWSEKTTDKGKRIVDEEERAPALKALETADLAAFVSGIVAHRRKLAFARLKRLVETLDAKPAT